MVDVDDNGWILVKSILCYENGWLFEEFVGGGRYVIMVEEGCLMVDREKWFLPTLWEGLKENDLEKERKSSSPSLFFLRFFVLVKRERSHENLVWCLKMKK